MRLVNLDFLNCPDSIRLTVNAMKVKTGELVYFDSDERRIGIDHVMASRTLPPGFVPVWVDGEVYSNTPLEVVLDEQDNRADESRVDTICLMVDLWGVEGEEPRTLDKL